MVLDTIESLLKKIGKSEKLAKLKEKLLKLKIEELEKKLKKKKSIPLQIIVAFMIPIFIFFSIDVRNMIIIFIIVVGVLFALYLYIGLSSIGGIQYFILSLAFLIILLIITQFINCGGKSCFHAIEERAGTLVASFLFLFTFVFFLVLGFITEGVSFWILSIITAVIMINLVQFISSPIWYKTCKNLPLVSTTDYCNPIKIRITPAQYLRVQTSGGVSVDFNAPRSMYAAEPYEYSFSIRNKFENNISFVVIPFLNIKYRTSSLYFTPNFQQKTSTITPNTSYQASVFFDTRDLKFSDLPISKSIICPYTATDIARDKGYYVTTPFGTFFNLEKVECASDKPCQNGRICVSYGSFKCTCLDFVDLSCSPEVKVYPGVYLKHTGFTRAKLPLYYYENYTKPVGAFSFSNDDITLTLEAIPNPYIASIHKYLNDVILFIKVKNKGGGIVKITKLKVLTPRTLINTTDLSQDVTLLEEVGTDIISCKGETDIFPYAIASDKEHGGELCRLSPPQIKATLTIKGETKTFNITYNALFSYCFGNFEKERWRGIFESLERSGICEIMYNNKMEKERNILNQSMFVTYVYVEVYYEKENIYSYYPLSINTRTRECIERCISYCMKEGRKEEECQKNCNL
jgi:hypothetical protein